MPRCETVLLETEGSDQPLTQENAWELTRRLQPLFDRYKTDFVLQTHFLGRAQREGAEPIMFGDVLRCVAGAMGTSKLQSLLGRNLSQWRMNPLSVMLINWNDVVRIPVGIHHLGTRSDVPAYNTRLRHGSRNMQEFRPITIWKGFGLIKGTYPEEYTITMGKPPSKTMTDVQDDMATIKYMAGQMGVQIRPGDLPGLRAAGHRNRIMGNMGKKEAFQAALRDYKASLG
jgi:hypothetical protein